MVIKLVAVFALAFGLSACGGSDDSPKDKPTSRTTIIDPGTTAPGGPELPDCGEIWKDGATLPEHYAGCVSNGSTRLEESTKCSDGSTLFIHDEQFYAVTGQKIVAPEVAPLEDTPAFGKVHNTCTGG